MKTPNLIPFKILSVDSLGQGVSKEDGKIVFIPKTLPGEEGTAKVVRKAKKVHFAEIYDLSTSAPERIASSCPHFHSCSGCQFLHTEYAYELELKTEAFRREFDRFFEFHRFQRNEIELFSADQRLHYRDRIQLHYSKKSDQIGFIDRKGELLPVPDCQIFRKEIRDSWTLLYDQWQHLAPTSKGHVELRFDGKKSELHWNKPYAAGGFTQVNNAMNKKMVELVTSLLQRPDIAAENLLDLFGGSGNLTQNFEGNVTTVDQYSNLEDALLIDLYSDDALELMTSNLAGSVYQFDTLVLDPPRSGFKHLDQWLKIINPKTLIYISCDYHTQKRDLEKLGTSYRLENVYLIDLFPGTRHLETLFVLKNASHKVAR